MKITSITLKCFIQCNQFEKKIIDISIDDLNVFLAVSVRLLPIFGLSNTSKYKVWINFEAILTHSLAYTHTLAFTRFLCAFQHTISISMTKKYYIFASISIGL